jgi:chromosome partitioning protein
VVIAVTNNKGGVGKTTTSVNLAAAFAVLGQRVLLVDLDSQASASLWFGVSRARLQPSVADCLLHDYPVSRAIRATGTAHLDLLTGSMDLASADLALCDVDGRELMLRRTLDPVRDRYDTILLDCPPSLSLVSVNAVMAADALVVPVTTQHLAIEGLANLMSAFDQVRNRLDGRARLLGILLTMVNGRGAARVSDLRQQYRERVFQTEIASSEMLEVAPSEARTIFDVAPESGAARAFRRLAAETLERFATHPRRSES